MLFEILFRLILFSLSLITFRLSNSFLPFAIAIVIFAKPFLLINKFNGTIVTPGFIDSFVSFLSSFLFNNNYLFFCGE